MARKKQEIALQSEIETQEEWEEMLSKEGLTVVDIYQEWAGPCKAMVAHFRRLKNEIGDDLLRFSVAKADGVDALERYRGRCEPCFLFYAGGSIVAVNRGVNTPLLLKTISDQLAYEHKVLDGNAERKEIRDTALGDADARGEFGDESDDEDQAGDQKKGVTVAILKPNLVADGKVDEVIEKMKEAGIDILAQEEKTLTEEEAREFYSHQQEQDYFEDLVKYMSSGPCHVLVLSKGETGEGIIEEWRELLGPPSVEEAKGSAPDSLRAKYGGTENYVNSLHGSDTMDTAMKELAFFFPDFAVPAKPGKKGKPGSAPKMQRTLALIRPDAMREKRDEILAKITEAGFTIAMQKEIQLNREQAEEFYKEHQGQEYFEELTTRMSSGPLLALALARADAVTGWRDLLGPTEVAKAKEDAPESLRAQFSIDDTPINQLHGSDTTQSAEEELAYFFPMQQTMAVIKPDAYQTKEEIMDKIREAGFHIAARKETEMTKEIAEQFYKDHNDKDYFGDLTEHMTSGPTLFMVLSREDAVDGWRSLIGSTDPKQAKEQDPDSLRAKYGTDIKANALHGSSNVLHAADNIKMMFGDIEFNADGTVKGETGPQEESQELPAEEQGEEQPATQQEGQQEEAQQQEGEEDKDKRASPDGGEDTEKEASKQPQEEPKEQEAQQEEQPQEAEGGKASPQAEETAEEEQPPQQQEGEEKTEGEEKPEEAQPQQEGGEEPQQSQETQQESEEGEQKAEEQKEDAATPEQQKEEAQEEKPPTPQTQEASDNKADEEPKAEEAETKEDDNTEQKETS